ncbi:formylglycine-generating enzyme family protein [Cecembia sp.]|uniref:formylglycine-generating enzyme family protein n=1 Tax=Cecembia sp. TaxID=1898110 RepID=UPI0025B9162F|nr:formylglycine-generating enzyme family protein [Cecembia sp.]
MTKRIHLDRKRISEKFKNRLFYSIFFFSIFLYQACKTPEKENEIKKSYANDLIKQEGMVLIQGGAFYMGTNEMEAYAVERPAVKRELNAFWMDETEVTNRQFAQFVEATGYLTVAERPVDWEELKLQLPPGTPKPDDADLEAGSLVFNPPSHAVPLEDVSLWWKWVVGANWRYPDGPGSDLQGKENHPVVHIAYEDAVAYADWVGKRLPTEAEWEYAAKAGRVNQRYAWGDEFKPAGVFMANTYQGEFPHRNLGEDGFSGTAPVKSFPPNDFGLYDMIGNVWELTSDWYDAITFSRIAGNAPALDSSVNLCYNPSNPFAKEKVIKGGSFLCADDYCINYRPSARQSQAYDSGTSNIGFRCVKDVE